MEDDFDWENINYPEIYKTSEPEAIKEQPKMKLTIKKFLNPIKLEINTTKYLSGFSISGLFQKELYNISQQKVLMTTDNKLLKIYNESALTKKGFKLEKYKNYLFNEWQNELIDKIHEGNNIILKIATSCGKTWATNSIISYYTLSTNKTALFVVPNSEILRDNIGEILKKNKKTYKSGGSNIIDTQTKSYSSFNDKYGSNAQIICITSDNFINFITNDANIDFIKKLKYIIFDEVHIPEVSNTLLWANLIPHNAQYILLSATINNIKDLINTIHEFSLNNIHIIEYNIRPIPLQRLLFKGLDKLKPLTGVYSSNLINQSKLTCTINLNDLTTRDMLYLNKEYKIFPESKIIHLEKLNRELQYELGQQIAHSPMVISNIDKINDKINEDIMEANIDINEENLYNLLAYLFSNDMGPVLVFGTNPNNIQLMVNNLIKYINYLESNDPEYILNEKLLNIKNKTDKNDKKLLELASFEETYGKFSKKTIKHERNLDLDEGPKIDYKILNRWRFPNLIDEEITYSSLEYGIGVYTHNISFKLRHKMFDYFKNNQIKLMFADSIISVGINLPIRTVILTGDITPVLYNQMGGRAGRRGLDTKGFIIPMFAKENIKKCILNNKENQIERIELKLTLSYLDLIKLLIPSIISSYYFTPIKDNRKKIAKLQKQIQIINNDLIITDNIKKQQIADIEKQISKLEISKDVIKKKDNDIITKQLETNFEKNLELKLSDLRQFILTKYIDTNIDKEIYNKIDYINKNGLNYHIISNILQSSDKIETIIFLLALINGDLDYISNEDEFIKFISTIIYREKGDNILIPDYLLDKLNSYNSALASLFNEKNMPNYNEPISNYLIDFYTYQKYDVKYINNIVNIGDWFYIILKQIKRIAPESFKLKDIIIKTDKKYVYAREVCGFSPIKKK